MKVSPLREPTYAPSELIHPETINGRTTWVPGRGLDELGDRIREFDPRLTLAYHGPSRRWEIWRLDGGTYNLIVRSRPDLPFPAGILEELKAHDTRAGFDPAKHLEEHNAKVEATKEAEASDKRQEAIDRLRVAMIKDKGHLYA